MSAHRVIARFLGVVTGAGLALAPGVPVAAAGTVIPIGVDHATPSGHNFEYTDYFPRGNVNVHQGDVLDFQWAFTPDGLHTATLLQSGESATAAWDTAHPVIVADSDDGPGQLQANPTAVFPSNPPPEASGGCGDAATPCSYDGSTDVNSGANGTDGTSQFFVAVNVPAGTTVTFVCLIHRGMQGSVKVVRPNKPATTPDQAAQAAQLQAASDTQGALEAEAAANNLAEVDNDHVTLVAGTATTFVEVAEMLPLNVTIQRGQTVRWVTLTQEDPHTVTFPLGTAQGEPFPAVCEASGGVDVPVTSSPPCGGNFSLFEIAYLPAPAGATSIHSRFTFGTSGVIATQVDRWHAVGTSTSFSFPNVGTFNYQCKVHEHMVGTLQVTAQD